MKRFWKNFYAAALAAVCVGAWIFFALAARSYFIYVLFGGIVGFVFAPILHEAGHVCFAKIGGFQVVKVKAFAFQYTNFSGKRIFSLRSPFAADETQALPKYSGKMKKRAIYYTAGGLIFGAVYLAVLALLSSAFVAAAGGASEVFFVEFRQGDLPFSAFRAAASFLYGMFPYGAYLLMLNAVPFVYGGGKTDGRVLFEISKGKPCGVRFLAALNAQGQLFEGKSYAEIDETYLQNLPVIAEDEPLFITWLFSSYYATAERREYERAARYINRISSLAEYLTEQERVATLCELLYLNAILGDEEQAEKCFCALKNEEAGQEESLAARERAFAAYYKMKSDGENFAAAFSRATDFAGKERCVGERKTLERLLQIVQSGDEI